MSGCVTRLSVVPATGPRGCRLQSQPIGRAALKTLKKKLKKKALGNLQFDSELMTEQHGMRPTLVVVDFFFGPSFYWCFSVFFFL